MHVKFRSSNSCLCGVRPSPAAASYELTRGVEKTDPSVIRILLHPRTGALRRSVDSPKLARGRLVPVTSLSRSDQMMVAVGFNPRWGDLRNSRVAERRLNCAIGKACGARVYDPQQARAQEPFAKSEAARPGDSAAGRRPALRQSLRESQRDSVLQPRVARAALERSEDGRHQLPWVNGVKLDSTLKGLHLPFRAVPSHYRHHTIEATTPLGLRQFLDPIPRVARSCRLRFAAARATLGWRAQSLWDWQNTG